MAESKKISCEEKKEKALNISDKLALLTDFDRGYIQGRIDERINERIDEKIDAEEPKQTA